MSIIAIKALIVFFALTYGVNPALTLRICELESDFDAAAIGDNGEAVGLYQWHSDPDDRGPWETVRYHMGRDSDPDLRYDPRENTETAMYAIGVMGLGHWWSTWEIAKSNVTAAREQEIGALEVPYEVFLSILEVMP